MASLLLPQVLRISSIGDAYDNIGRQLKDGHWVSYQSNAMARKQLRICFVECCTVRRTIIKKIVSHGNCCILKD